MDAVVAAVRCRPLTTLERDSGCRNTIEFLPQTNQVLVARERAFSLNHVYSEDATQKEIYDTLVDPVVEKVMKGFTACVMAYGQTGSGKTYTMGTKVKAPTPGIVQKALERIFSSSGNFEVHVSFLEVYKEEVLDLLSPEKKKMHLVEFKPVGLTLKKTGTMEVALSEMEKGLKNRHVGATNANLHSSRSHAVFTIHFSNLTEDGRCSSKLYLVDLAGSESVSEMSGDTRKEGVMINKGLLQLGNVMSALSSSDHVPYRNSALTTVLKDTLSPQNYVVLIACISPLETDASMTVNSLQFASRVRSIKGNPEAGLLIKQRNPIMTPFKVPSNFKRAVNSTIATPGSHGKVTRPVLRPFNNTFSSPGTPRVNQKKQENLWPTSTPFLTAKPLCADPTPILKVNAGRSVKRRSSSEWDSLNISSSTIIDATATQVKAQAEVNQTSLVQNAENETWLRSVIADVIREELRNTFLSQTRVQDGLSPPKQPRRSARLSMARQEGPSFFEHDGNTTIMSSSPKEKKIVTDSEVSQSNPVRKSIGPVRRSTRLSVAPKPLYFADSPVKQNLKVTKQTKKAARLSTRLSMLPKATSGNAQSHMNNYVLEILQSGNIKKLQSLPTIGPKTAVIISNHSLLHGPIKSFKDLVNVRGLSVNFRKRFLWANNIILEDDLDETASS